MGLWHNKSSLSLRAGDRGFVSVALQHLRRERDMVKTIIVERGQRECVMIAGEFYSPDKIRTGTTLFESAGGGITTTGSREG